MKNFFKSLSLKGRIAVCSAAVAFGNASTALAQANIGETVLNESADSMKNLVGSLVRVLQVALGLGALVTLVIVVFNLFKGEREAAQKVAWWVVGLALGFALLTVVATVIDRV